MSKQNTIDDVFRNGLGSYQEPFDPGAWEHMQKTLDSTPRKPFILFFFFRKKNMPFTFIAIPMILLSILFFTSRSPVETAATEKAPVISSHNPTPSRNTMVSYSEIKNQPVSAPVKNKASLPLTASAAPRIKNTTPALAQSVGKKYTTAYPVLSRYPDFPMLSFENRIGKTSTKATVSRTDHYNCAHGGLHIYYLMPQGNYAGAGQKPGFGFDIEGYSRNLTKRLPVGFFLGGNAGFTLLDKSTKYDTYLNNNTGNPAVTYLQNNRFHLNLRARAEMGKGDVKFYVLGYAGFNTYFVDQRVDLTATQNSNDNTSKNVWTNTLPAWGAGAGIRYHFTPGVSFDMNVVYNSAKTNPMVSVSHSAYNAVSGNFALSKVAVNPQTVGIQVGILFCMHKYNTTTTTHNSTSPGIIIMPVPGSAPRPSGNSNTHPAPRPAPQTKPAPSRAPSHPAPSRPANPRVIPR